MGNDLQTRARNRYCMPYLQVVILFYLFDNDTSFVVLFSSVLGTGIEIWKVRTCICMMYAT